MLAVVLGAFSFAPAAEAAPRTLTAKQAVGHVRTAVKQEFFNARTPRRPRCRRVTRLRFSCRATWTDGFQRFSGRVVIYRTGPTTSPVDFYRLTASSGGRRFIPLQRYRESGRIVVETRRTRLARPLRLTGLDDSTDIEILAGLKIDPLPAGEFDQPPPGTRFVAFGIGIRNRSRTRYDDSLSAAARLVTTANTTIATTYVSPCSDADAVSVPARETRVGCVVFAVPFGVALRQLEYQPNGGFGRETGVWALR
jgi:hypothetical protein